MSQIFTDENFNKDVIETSNAWPVLVDFYATWCGPCKLQGVIVDSLADEVGEKAVIGKVNTEYSKQVAKDFNIMSIPTIIIFKDGEAKETVTGLQSKEYLLGLLKKYYV